MLVPALLLLLGLLHPLPHAAAAERHRTHINTISALKSENLDKSGAHKTPRGDCLGGFSRCPTRALCVLFPTDCASICPDLANQRTDLPLYACPDRQQCATAAAWRSTCPVAGTIWDDQEEDAVRVASLVDALGEQDKINQLTDKAPGIAALAVPPFNWLNDDEHGVKQHQGTSFPNGVTLGQSWDGDLVGQVGGAISLEARGIFNADVALAADRGVAGNSNGIGVTLYAPNLNLVRNPLWGRAQEVFSEDPVLTGTLTEHFVKGIQLYKVGRLQSLACCKHWAAYDLEGPYPTTRFNFSAKVDARNMLESYLPAFDACVRRAGGKSVMCSYNSINGIPTCGDGGLLNTLLRDSLGFDGFVVSDYDAWANMVSTHHYASNLWEAAKIGIEAGMDQEGGGTSAIEKLYDLVNSGSVKPAAIDQAVTRLFKARVELGLFDAPADNPFGSIWNDTSTVASKAHLDLAFEAAAAGTVLHFNKNNVLPINDQFHKMQRVRTAGVIAPADNMALDSRGHASAKSVCLVGPQGNMTTLLQGNYAVPPSRPIETILEGLREYFPSITFVQGCSTVACTDAVDKAGIAAACSSADVAIVTFGLDQTFERETHDRSTLALPSGQLDMLNATRASLPSSSTVVGVLIRGGTVIVDNDFQSKVDALLDAGYPGERGGAAIAALVAGVRNPSARTAVTYYASDSDLPDIAETDWYASPGITYRYSSATPTFAFGTGESYSSFAMSNVVLDSTSFDACATAKVSFLLANTGSVDGATVAQVYVKQIGFPVKTPNVRLADFVKVQLAAGAQQQVSLSVAPTSRFYVNDGGSIYDTSLAMVGPGSIQVIVSLQGPFDSTAVQLQAEITGNVYRLDECQ